MQGALTTFPRSADYVLLPYGPYDNGCPGVIRPPGAEYEDYYLTHKHKALAELGSFTCAACEHRGAAPTPTARAGSGAPARCWPGSKALHPAYPARTLTPAALPPFPPPAAAVPQCTSLPNNRYCVYCAATGGQPSACVVSDGERCTATYQASKVARACLPLSACLLRDRGCGWLLDAYRALRFSHTPAHPIPPRHPYRRAPQRASCCALLCTKWMGHSTGRAASRAQSGQRETTTFTKHQKT